MKKFFFLLLLGAGGFIIYRMIRARQGPVKVDPRSLQASRTAAPVQSRTDMLRDRLVVSAVAALPTIVAGLAPSRWFNSQDTKEVYEANERGENVSPDPDQESFSD